MTYIANSEQEAYKLTIAHTCPYVQKYDHETKYKGAENTSPRYDAHVKSVIVFKSVDLEKDQVGMYFLSSHVQAQ